MNASGTVIKPVTTELTNKHCTLKTTSAQVVETPLNSAKPYRNALNLTIKSN